MRTIYALILCLVIPGVLGCAPRQQNPSPEPEEPTVSGLVSLESLTEAHTRVTWIRQTAGPATDPFATGDYFVLMGLDTRDGLGERTILEPVDNYRKPLLSADGERIVYTDLPALEVHVVDWDGGGQRRLGTGMGIELWQDPETGVEWVYYAQQYLTNDTLDGVGLMRMALDDPDRKEPVWDRTHVTPDNFQLSADGTRAAGLFPWKAFSVLNLETGILEPQGKGCWTSMAPDNSYLCWVFDGAHKNLLIKRPGSGRATSVAINRAPGIDGHEVYHPRWSNHVRIMAMTGPYTVMGRYNAITGGGDGVNLYVGRFREDMSAVEAWCQVTDDQAVDIFPDVWVAGAASASAAPGGADESAGAETPTGQTIRATLRLVETTATPSLEDISPYKSTLVDYAYDVVSVEHGALDAERIIVRHWGIRDSVPVDINQELGSTVSLSVEPVDEHPWLMGERVSGTLADDFLYEVYLDVGRFPPPDAE